MSGSATPYPQFTYCALHVTFNAQRLNINIRRLPTSLPYHPRDIHTGGQPIDLFFRDIGKWEKSRNFHFLLLSGIGRWKKVEKFPSLRRTEKWKRSRFFHFSDARENRKRSRNFRLFITRRNGEKVKKFPSLYCTEKLKKV